MCREGYDIMNAMTTRHLSFAVFLLAARAMPLSSGDYQAKTVAVQPVESYPARVTVEQVTVAVDPYANDGKSRTAFAGAIDSHFSRHPEGSVILTQAQG